MFRARRLVVSLAVAVIVFGSRAQAQLNYVDSSGGLQQPGMEGGRTEIEFADVDGDGNLDLVSVGDHGSPFVNTSEHGVMVWFSDGAGSWSLFQTGSFGYGGVGLGDVNNDGLLDIGYGIHHDYSSNDFGDQLLEVALGDGTGRSWTPWDDGLATNGETWGMFGVDLADVDNDGDLDIGSISFGCCAGIHVYLNQGDGTWVQSFGFVGGNSRMDFVFGDVNGDGFADFAAAHGNGTVYLGDGLGGFARDDGNLPTPTWRSGVSLGDVNGDGRDDLAFVTSNRGLAVWTWVSPGNWQDISGTLPVSGSFRATQLVDMDLDGRGDLVAYSNDAIAVFSDDGTGAWRLIATIPTLPNTCAFSALRAGTDIDHNGLPDIGVVAEEDCGIFVNGVNRPRVYRETSVPTSVWIHAKFPRGGETLIAGSVRFIDWHAAVADPSRSGMTIELSTSGPAGPWTPVAAAQPDNGRFQWLLDPALPTSSNCYLRYALQTASGPASAITPTAFTILGGAIVGDLNGDGCVDLADLGILLADFGCTGGSCVGDLDGDGDTDLADLGILLAAFGNGCA